MALTYSAFPMARGSMATQVVTAVMMMGRTLESPAASMALVFR